MDESWRVENFYQEISGGSLEYVCGQEVFKNLFYTCIPNQELEEWLRLPKTWCFLLSGENGVGKTYLAKAFAAEMAQYEYHFLVMDGIDLVGKSEQETLERIKKLGQVLLTGEGLFLMLQGLDRLQGLKASVMFAKELEKLKTRNYPVVIVALTENQEEIFPVLQKVFYICRLTFPDKDARNEYFKNYWKDSFLVGKPKFNAEQMAEITEGMNYTQLELLRMCVMGVMWQQGSRILKTSSEFKKAVKSGKLRISEKRFRQIAASVRRGIILPETMHRKEANTIETTDAKNQGMMLQESLVNSQPKVSESLLSLDNDIPAPSWLTATEDRRKMENEK